MSNDTSDNTTIQISVGKSHVMLISKEDLVIISQYKIYIKPKSNTAYASCYWLVAGKRVQTGFHRIVLSRVLGRELTRDEVCDHINGNGLDNRRENLRVASRSQNQMNKKMHKNNPSGYKGVHLNSGKWDAVIRTKTQRIRLGRFVSRHDAARAYNEAALKYHGEFARLNVIEE